MKRKRAATVLVLGLSFALVGCNGDGLSVGQSGITVEANLSAVALSYDCDNQPAGAKPAPGSEGDAAPCLDGTDCRSFCQQSSMTIQLKAAAGTGDVAVEIVAVRVISEVAASNRDELMSREPTVWNASSQVYQSWDERLDAGAMISAQYKLSAPDWAALTAGDNTRKAGGGSGDTYRVEVDLIIDGVQRTITLGGVSREPDIAT